MQNTIMNNIYKSIVRKRFAKINIEFASFFKKQMKDKQTHIKHFGKWQLSEILFYCALNSVQLFVLVHTNRMIRSNKGSSTLMLIPVQCLSRIPYSFRRSVQWHAQKIFHNRLSIETVNTEQIVHFIQVRSKYIVLMCRENNFFSLNFWKEKRKT